MLTVFGIQDAPKSFGTFLAPFGVLVDTDGARRSSMRFDFSGESQQDSSGSNRFTAFTRQGSEVQSLSRLPLNSRSYVRDLIVIKRNCMFYYFPDIS